MAVEKISGQYNDMLHHNSGNGVDKSRRTWRTALVTGGAKRIGEAMVRDLAAHGFAVAVHANQSLAEAQGLVNEINGGGGKAVALRADLTDPQAAAKLVGDARAALGPIGLVVNNASVFERDAAHYVDLAVWERHFALHVKAPALIAAAFAQQTELSEGLIVNIVDQRVWKLTPEFFSYTLSKSALWTMTQTMAQAFAPIIRVNAIGPGPALASERQAAPDFARQINGLPLKQGPKLAEFGATLRYLFATPSITGQMIALDGGQHLAWQTPDVTAINE